MGWAGGTDIMQSIIDAFWVEEDLPWGLRARLYIPIIEALEDADWDGQDECLGLDPVFDIVLKELHPEWDWEDTDEHTDDDTTES